MAVPARYTRILVDEFDFSGDSNSVGVTGNVAVLDDTRFQQAAMTNIPGLPNAEISHQGYHDAKGAGELEQELHARLGTATAVYVAALFGTNAAACPAYVTAQTWGQQLNINAPLDNLITLQGQWPASGGLRRGIRIFSGTLDATGGQTSVDLGAAGSAGGKAYFFIQDITGTATDAEIDIESSATGAFGGEEASEGTATFSAVGVQVVSMSGTVNRHVRINITDLGGADDFTIVCIISVDGVTHGS